MLTSYNYFLENMFQLTTSRRGRRRTRLPENFGEVRVSTHDLTKRSTGFCTLHISHRKSFNSRPHEEVDQIPGTSLPFTMFQLTTSRRGRLRSSSLLAYFRSFNSRPHEEVDLHPVKNRPFQNRFNSRPHEEVDSNFYAKSFPFKITFCAHCI